MKRIYLLGVVLLIFVLLGVTFYAEDINFHAYVKLIKITKTQSETTYTFCIIGINRGPLPMSANFEIAVYAGIQSSLFPKAEYYRNITSITVNPFSTNRDIVTLTTPPYQVFDVYTQGYGNYNWKLSLEDNITLTETISELNEYSQFQPIQIKSTSSNATIIPVPRAYPYYLTPYPVTITVYPNNTAIYSISFNLNTKYIKILSGTYTVKMYVDGSLVNETTLTINQGQLITIYGNLPQTSLFKASDYEANYNITVYLSGNGIIYYFNEIVSI